MNYRQAMDPLEVHMRAILQRLKCGPATGPQLAAIQWRFSATIFALRQIGFRIKSTRVQGRLWKYTLDRRHTPKLRRA